MNRFLKSLFEFFTSVHRMLKTIRRRTEWIHLFFLHFCLILCSCNLPNDKASVLRTAEAETAVLSYIQTVQAEYPPETPQPTETLLPTSACTPEPSLTPSATFGPTPTSTLGPEYFHGSLWYEPEYVSQEGLRYNETIVNTGCTAASVQMVLDFWHAYKEEYPTMTAQRLIDLNTWQHQFNPKTGLNIMNTEDELQDMKYYLGTRQDSNKTELLTALERYGPLLVLTKVNWTPFGANHMAVVTGYDAENDIIRILDPWQVGGIMEFPYENFDGIWSLNYLDDETETLQRTFFFIIPYAELGHDNEPFIPSYELAEIKLHISD